MIETKRYITAALLSAILSMSSTNCHQELGCRHIENGNWHIESLAPLLGTDSVPSQENLNEGDCFQFLRHNQSLAMLAQHVDACIHPERWRGNPSPLIECKAKGEELALLIRIARPLYRTVNTLEKACSRVGQLGQPLPAAEQLSIRADILRIQKQTPELAARYECNFEK